MNSMIRKGFNIILLKGNMGSGKTHFVKEYMKNQYNFEGVTSPTYTFLNTYVVNGVQVAHFDCYQKMDYDILTDGLLNYDLIFIEWFDQNIIKLLTKYVIVDCEFNTIEYYE
jgi:tRNA threonylcarbamoyladenosine biosynthesis protein TsaE